MISTDRKTCSFNCVYCQLGKTGNPLNQRKEFVPLDILEKELMRINATDADYATFSGMGEPTLASNLGAAIKIARSILKLPVAVLTNSYLMDNEDVCNDLQLADIVIAKVDASREEVFQQINRPHGTNTLSDILNAIKSFRKKIQSIFYLLSPFLSKYFAAVA